MIGLYPEAGWETVTALFLPETRDSSFLRLRPSHGQTGVTGLLLVCRPFGSYAWGSNRNAQLPAEHGDIWYAAAPCDVVSSSPCQRSASAECWFTRLIVKSFDLPHKLTNPFAFLSDFSLGRKL